MPIFSAWLEVSRNPAVSDSRSTVSPQRTDSVTTSRVVPASSVTMARSYPARLLSKEDFPTLGRPRMVTGSPSFSTLPRWKPW